MGAAARKLAHSTAPARPALRLVPARAPRGHRRARTSANSAVFRVAVVCLLILATAGVARVALAAQAAEAAVDAWELKAELKAERTATRSLEADRSSLVAPSRIEVLACETLNMSAPLEVCYLELPSGSQPEPGSDGEIPDADSSMLVADHVSEQVRPAGMTGIVGTLVELAAGEAQVLLVGDMGLGSSR